MRKLLFIVNEASFFLSHRLQIAQSARQLGYEVHVASAPSPQAADVTRLGLMHHAIPLSRRGSNPIAELRAFQSIRSLLRSLRPDIVHLVTVKPVIYGGIAARLENVPTVAAIAGLGYLFGSSLKSALMRLAILPLYRLALARAAVRVIFQNEDDRRRLSEAVGLAPETAVLIHGSGVTLGRYRAQEEPETPPVVVTFASRLLWPKGVGEFVEAARLLRHRGRGVRFLLAGDPDPGNPLSLTKSDVRTLRHEQVVEVLGHRDDLPEVFAQSHIVVLPSYYGEGLPKVLLEAAASGRAVVTTDHPGCRDAVVEGETGLLVPIKDASRLADAIERLMLDEDRRRAMGRAARRLAEKEFGIEKVVEAHLAIYAALLQGR